MEFEDYAKLGINERGELLWNSAYEQLQYNLGYHLFTATYHKLEWRSMEFFDAVYTIVKVSRNLKLVLTVREKSVLMIVVTQNGDMRCITFYK